MEPLPPKSLLDMLAERLERAFGQAVRIMDPVRTPVASRLGADRSAAEPVRAAIAATWGCGCRDRLVGVTAATLVGDDPAPGCGGVLVLSVTPGAEVGAFVRAVGRSFGLADCADPGCAMHPRGDAPRLCRACRERC
ncbi:MAG: hypothetical protein ABFC38_12645 [Methanospirillum sp.]